MNKDDLIVVCGGRGFVGRSLLADLQRQGFTRLRSISRSIDDEAEWKTFHDQRSETRNGIQYWSADLSNENQALGAIRDAKYVFNLAAAVGGIDFIQNNRSKCMLSAQININLLKACHAIGVLRYFFASSACVYSSNEFPIRENFTEPANPERGYGWEKLFGEQLCREFREDGNVDTRIARYFTLYGPGDDKEHNHFPAELCKKIARAKLLQHNQIELWGDGSQTRSFLFIDDCVEGTQRIMNSGVTVPLNLSGEDRISVNEAADLVQKIAGTDLMVKYTGGVTGVHSRFADNTKIRLNLDWEPATSLQEGFEKTYRFWWDETIRQFKK